MRILLFSEVTLFKYNGSTILSLIVAYCRASNQKKCLLLLFTFQFLIRWLGFACSCFALFHLYFRIQTLTLLACFWTLKFAGLREEGNTLKLRQPARHVTNFPSVLPVKLSLFWATFPLSHPEKGHIVNIWSSTKIWNLALGNLVSVGSFKRLF